MSLKCSLSNAYKIQSISAIIDAYLGALYNRANSPNASPDLYTYKYFSFL